MPPQRDTWDLCAASIQEENSLRRLHPVRIAPIVLLSLFATSGLAPHAVAQSGGAIPLDKYAWLEEIYGDKQLAWVREHNQRTAAVLEKDPHFSPLQAEALKVLESPDRLPWPDRSEERRVG